MSLRQQLHQCQYERQLDTLTVAELRDEARVQSIPFKSTATKSDLKKLLLNFWIHERTRTLTRSPSRSKSPSPRRESTIVTATLNDIKKSWTPSILRKKQIRDIHDERKVKTLYGPYAHTLTRTIAEKLVGKTLYAVYGNTIGSASSEGKRLHQVNRIEIRYISKDYITIYEFRYKSEYEFYESKGKIVCCSGADPVYVFLR
jgi:hypothetical protein